MEAILASAYVAAGSADESGHIRPEAHASVTSQVHQPAQELDVALRAVKMLCERYKGQVEEPIAQQEPERHELVLADEEDSDLNMGRPPEDWGSHL